MRVLAHASFSRVPEVPFSFGVLSPALPLFLYLAPAPPLSPPAAFASLLSHRYSQLDQKTGNFPGGHPLRSVAACQTHLHLERQATAYNVDQNPIFRYFEKIIRYSSNAVSDYGYNPERSLLKYSFLQICSYLGPQCVSKHDF